MATIDELVMRLDADLKPLETKLKRAERLLKDFSRIAERELSQPLVKMAALLNARPSGFPIGRPQTEVATFLKPNSQKMLPISTPRESAIINAGESTTVPTQEVLAGPLGKFLLDITINVGKGLATDFILDTFLSDEFKPEEELFKDTNFDPSRIQEAFFEFEARSKDLAKAAEESTLAEDRILKELAAIRSKEIAGNIRSELEQSLERTASELTRTIRFSTADLNFSALEADALERLKKRFEAFGIAREPTGAESAFEIFRQAQSQGIQISEATKDLAARIPQISEALDRIASGIPDPETQARIARAREAAEPVQRLELEIPEGLGNACGCIRDELDRLLGPNKSNREEDPTILRTSTSGTVINGAQVDLKAVEDQAAAWQGVLDRLDKVPPALARTRQETLEVDRAVRDLGFTFASAFEGAIVKGESLSDILQGLEEDILRILTRLLITEPLARGLTAGLGSFTGGGLGSGGGFGALANLFPSPAAGVGLGTFNALAPIAAQDVANPLLAGIFQTGGPVIGPVHGPGGPTGDRIPALLSDGEFVVNAEAV